MKRADLIEAWKAWRGGAGMKRTVVLLAWYFLLTNLSTVAPPPATRQYGPFESPALCDSMRRTIEKTEREAAMRRHFNALDAARRRGDAVRIFGRDVAEGNALNLADHIDVTTGECWKG